MLRRVTRLSLEEKKWAAFASPRSEKRLVMVVRPWVVVVGALQQRVDEKTFMSYLAWKKIHS